MRDREKSSHGAGEGMYVCKHCKSHLKLQDRVCPSCLQLARQDEAPPRRTQPSTVTGQREQVGSRRTRGALLAAALGVGVISAVYLEKAPNSDEELVYGDVHDTASSGELSIPLTLALHTVHPVLGPLLTRLGRKERSPRSRFAPAYGAGPANPVNF